MMSQPNQLMKAAIAARNRTLSAIISLVLLAACLQSCKDHGDADKSAKTQFYTMGMTTREFLGLVDSSDFQSFNFQFQNTGKNKEGNFQFDFSSYAWRKPIEKEGEFFESQFIKPVPGRKDYDFEPPYRFANLELWNDTIQAFFKKLDSLGSPISQFDSIIFIPFRDKNRYAALYLVPIRKGEEVDADNLPVIKPGEGQAQQKAAAPAGAEKRYLEVYPCPPDCPHRAPAPSAKSQAVDEVRHVH